METDAGAAAAPPAIIRMETDAPPPAEEEEEPVEEEPIEEEVYDEAAAEDPSAAEAAEAEAAMAAESAPMETDGGAATEEAAAASLVASDLDTARPFNKWNMAQHLPPATQKYFYTAVAMLVWHPWSEAARVAKEGGRAAPTRDAVAASALQVFDEYMGNQLLEYVAEIHRDIPSSGAVEQQAVADGAASARTVAKAFPVLPGSHLKMESPALEFIKMVSHLVELDTPLQERSLAKGLRRNCLRLLDVREFSTAAKYANPCLTYVLPGVVCDFCGHAADLDLCRDVGRRTDDGWACTACHQPHDADAIEARLVQLVQRNARAYQLQDLQCAKCRTVQRHHSSTRCEKCAAAFSLRLRVDAVETSLATFANIADHLHFPWLAETVAFLRGQGFSQAPEIF